MDKDLIAALVYGLMLLMILAFYFGLTRISNPPPCNYYKDQEMRFVPARCWKEFTR